MELELGLGLPNYNINYQRESSSSSSAGAGIMVKGHVDLNCGDGVVAPKNRQHQRYTSRNNYNQLNSSSCLSAADDEVESKDLCNLLLWSGRQPNEEDPDPNRWPNLHLNHQNNNIINDEEEEEIVVGWPPINSVMRKELVMVQHQGHDDGGGGDRRMRKSWRYVKVKMEGVGIGRKIDVTLYHSYQALTHALIHIMFANYTDASRELGDYAILYQDKQGDWMMLPTDHHHHHHILPWE
ncbi:UNVERIFIED_CONTAM: Auxin-responsive protein IAA29 [Sesamum indicum]